MQGSNLIENWKIGWRRGSEGEESRDTREREREREREEEKKRETILDNENRFSRIEYLSIRIDFSIATPLEYSFKIRNCWYHNIVLIFW